MSNCRKYKKIDILFFERPIADLKKFAFKIAKKLKGIDENISLGAICIELPETENTEIKYFYHWNDIKYDIDDFLTKSKVKLVVFSNNRIPDIEFILHAKKLGIKTVLIQEGLVYDGISINDVTLNNIVKSFYIFFDKSLAYINTIRRMCKYDSQSFCKLIYKICKEKNNINIILLKSFSYELRADYVLTMGEVWTEYYCNKVGFSRDQIRLVGDHDLDSFDINNNNEDAICYIATVAVEDGMVSKQVFLNFIDCLANSVDKKCKFYLKLHPRSDLALYDALKDHNICYINTPGYLPSVNLYIGHRGSLIGRALYESDNLIIWKFSKEEFCFYEKFASFICSNRQELLNAIHAIDITKKKNNKQEEISKVYWKNPNGSINAITEIIYNYYLGNVI